MKRIVFLLVFLAGIPSLSEVVATASTLNELARDSIFKEAATISKDSLRSAFLRNAFQQYIGQESANEFLDSAIALCIRKKMHDEEIWGLYDYCRQYEYRAELSKQEQRLAILKDASYRYNTDYSFYYTMWYSVLQSRCAVGDTEYAIIQAKEMAKEADRLKYNSGKFIAALALAQAYDYIGRYNDAVETYKQALIDNPKANENALLVIHTNLGRIYRKQEKYPQALNELRQQLKILTKLQENTASSNTFQSTFLDLEINFCNIYMAMQNKEKLNEHLKRAQTYYDENIYLGARINYHSTWAVYYKLAKEWDKCLDEVNTTLKLCRGMEPLSENRILKTKADVLMETGDYAEAAHLYKVVAMRGDSLNLDILQRHEEAHQINHKIRTALLEKEKITKHYRYIQLTAGCIILLLLIFVIIRAFLIRRQLQRSEEETRQAFETIKAADHLKERFLHNITYEIRIPLNTVVGFSELLSSENNLSEEELEEYSTVVKTNSSKLLALINNILDLSRLEAGMMRFNVQECDVVQLCREAKMMTEMQNPGSTEITFNTNLEELQMPIDSKWLLKLLTSLFAVPPGYAGEPRKIEYTLGAKEKKLIIIVKGSPLYQGWEDEQEQNILHNINRLYVEAFCGRYQILGEANKKQVFITYPLS